jgi:VWFA-related protein
MISRRGICICLFGFSLLCVFAQQNGPAGQFGPTASVPPDSAHRRIALDVVVTDKSGKPVPGLQQQDFTLLDNKQPQKIVSFHAVEGGSSTTDPPVEAILLVDEANASVINLATEREQIAKFLRQDNGKLPRPVSMAYLTDSGISIGKASSRDGNALITDLNQKEPALHTITRSQGFYGAADRQQLSLNALKQLLNYETARPGRKLVIWISPGWPLLTGPDVELTPKNQQWVFNTIVGLSDGLRQARITLYQIDPLGMADAGEWRTSYYEEFVKGVKNANQVQIGNLALQVLAVQTGGRALNSSNDVAGEIARCATDADAFYVLTFDGLAGDGPNEYHALEVKIGKPGLTVRTRSGYYAQPEPAPAH